MAPPVAKKKKRSSANRRPISTVGQTQPQPMGSFWTPFGGRKSVRLAHKRNKPLKEISICNDVWWNVLPFFDHFQLGLKLALLSPRFDWLVDKHFEAKTTELTIWREIRIQKDKKTDEAKLSIRIKKRQFVRQLPKCPLPVKIRFMRIQISYIDHSVITFFRTNKQIFDKGTKFEMSISIEWKIWHAFAREIWPIFAGNIRHLDFHDCYALNNLCRFISPTFLTDLKHLNTIDSNFLLPDVSADDGPSANSSCQALAKWLHTPTTDGRPKRLCFKRLSRAEGWIKRFKGAFLLASSPACYVIKILFCLYKDTTPIEPFELVNEQTQEKLTLIKEANDYEEEEDVEFVSCGLKRCPIGETVQWEDKTLDNLSGVFFDLYGECIGPLSSPTEAGPGKEKVV